MSTHTLLETKLFLLLFHLTLEFKEINQCPTHNDCTVNTFHSDKTSVKGPHLK